MAKDPAFLFYSADFYMGTVGMSNAQVGQYIRLMCLQHQQGRLTEALVKSVTGSNPDEAVMSKFIKDENGLFYNVRLEKEAQKRSAYVSSRRKNARSKKAEDDTPDDENDGAETEHMQEQDGNHMHKHMCEHMPEHMQKHMDDHMENENENVNISIKEIGGTGGKRKPVSKITRFIKPTVEEVKAYCRERGNNIDPAYWFDFYESKGWKIGKNMMKDWKAAVRTWERNQMNDGGNRKSEESQGDINWSI